MFGGEHKQTDIAQSAIFTTGSMRASRLYPALLLTLLLMYGDFLFDLSSKIRISFSYLLLNTSFFRQTKEVNYEWIWRTYKHVDYGVE